MFKKLFELYLLITPYRGVKDFIDISYYDHNEEKVVYKTIFSEAHRSLDCFLYSVGIIICLFGIPVLVFVMWVTYPC